MPMGYWLKVGDTITDRLYAIKGNSLHWFRNQERLGNNNHKNSKCMAAIIIERKAVDINIIN